MDKFFILHADHEQNASTSSVRLAGSSGAKTPIRVIKKIIDKKKYLRILLILIF